MPDRDLFPEGVAPDRAELIQYLTGKLGLTHDDARNVAARYHPPESGGFGGTSDVEWTESRLDTWLQAQPEVRNTDMIGAVAGAVGQSMPGATPKVDPHERDDERIRQATEAADQASRRASGVRDRYYRAGQSVGFDSGPGMDPAALAQSLAVGYFTDASGNPVIDPDTGQPTEVNAATLWQTIKGQTFDMGTLKMPAPPRPKPPRGRRSEEQDARMARLGRVQEERRTFVTPSMAMAMLGTMDDDYLIGLQQSLWEAGLFGETPPSWGQADDATRKAYMALFAEASLSPDESIDRVLARLEDEAITRGKAGGGTGEDAVPAFKPEVASAESLRQLIDQTAQNLLGRDATDDEKAKIVGSLQSKEMDTQRAQYDRDIASATGGSTAGGGIDAFMAAISGQESGGDYNAQNPSGAYGKFQIMPGNWGPWAERAGIGRNAPRTPQNQEIVARHVMTEYYQRFGNWRDVAIAWFAGPGAVGNAAAERRSDGNMTVREYADLAMANMAKQGGGGTGLATGAMTGAIETFDPAAEAQAALKAADPAGWTGHRFAERAGEFYSLLGGLT